MSTRSTLERDPHGGDDLGQARDGRRLRREQGRTAVLDASIDLVLAGISPPTVEQIAEQAGVSVASVYRYFATVDELRSAGIVRYLERYGHLMTLPDDGDHELDHRIGRLVDARLRFYETVEPVARLARRQAASSPETAATLAGVRATLADQLSQRFAVELDRLRPAARAERLATITVLTSFEAWDQMTELGLSRDAIGRAWRTHLRLLLDQRSA